MAEGIASSLEGIDLAKKTKKAEEEEEETTEATEEQETGGDSNSKGNGKSAAKGAAAKKGEQGYHYWHQQANQGTAPRTAPQKLTAEEAAALEKEGGDAGGQGSSWNKAGTWEERGHTDWAKARVDELVLGKALPIPGMMPAGATVAIKSVKTFKGDATVVMVRGKPRHGFDFDITLTWEAEFPVAPGVLGLDSKKEKDAPKPVKGTIDIPEASGDTVSDDELEYTVTVENRKTERRAQEDAAYKVLKTGLRAFFRETFATIDKELLVRAKGGAEGA
mmetsp:Transcript_14460/g.34882  ORF Transcript_14460/g.34882 Transcript_14460/m.34882 type:complete len:277 (+) Transcript_14460:415-1245(+)